MTVNSKDKEAIQLNDIKVSYTPKYTYLGAVISNQSITKQLKDHIEAKQPHIRKFTSFLTKNANCPYKEKIKVWTSALNAALSYSCETWLTENLKPTETFFNSMLKQAIGAR